MGQRGKKPEDIRKCQNCKKSYTANSENFRINRTCALGISYKCRFCGKTPYDRKYRAKNKEKHYEHLRKYNKQRRLRLRFKVLEKDGNKCVYCGISSKNCELQIDHIFPKSKGGINNIENYVSACKNCNIGKGDYILTEFQ